MDNNQPPMNQMNQPMNSNPAQERSVGPVIGLIIILVIIVIGGIYFWHSRQSGQNPTGTSQSTQTQNSDQTVQAIQAQSSSDDVNSIKSDLNNFNQNDINNVDSDIK